MEESAKESRPRGRPKSSVLERIQKFLDQDVLHGEPPLCDREAHWLWKGKLKSPRAKTVNAPSAFALKFQNTYVMPARIRDEDGKLRAVVRILFRELRGVDFSHYTVIRTHGCNYTCVNPYHIKLPEGLNDVEEPPVISSALDDEIEELAQDIGNFIAANGRDDDEIMNRFLLDYSETEIKLAMARLE